MEMINRAEIACRHLQQGGRTAILTPPLLLDLGELTKISGLFLTVLITLELFGILEVMLLENTVHVEFVVAVALIAAARESWLWNSLRWLR